MQLINTLLYLTALSGITAHSWLDCIGDANKKYTGPNQIFSSHEFHEYCTGFGRGYPGRANRWINDIYTVLVENRGGNNKAEANVCKKTQVTQNYTSEFPMTKAKPGAKLKFWYELDNHYTIKPTYVHLWGYGKPGKDISKYSELTDETHIFKHQFALPDNQNCMDIHNANSLCWFYWEVPKTYQKGIYSFLWNWRWDQNPTGEEYNTCFDLEVTEGGVEEPSSPTSSKDVPTYSSQSSKQVYPTLIDNKPVETLTNIEYLTQKPNNLVQGGNQPTKRPKCHKKY